MSSEDGYSDATDRELFLLGLIEKSSKLDSYIEQQDFEESLSTVAQLIQDAEEINKQTSLDELQHNTNQVVLDTTLMKMNFKHISKLLTFINNFNDSHMAKPINDIVFKDGIENWNNLANKVCCFSKTVTMNPTMVGYVEAKPKQRVQRERRTRNKSVKAVEQKPITVTKIVGEERGVKAVEETIKQISDLYTENGYTPIPYYHLIIDPNDFSNTVQNSFNLSFLVRENVLLIEDGHDGYPQVRLLNEQERQDLAEKIGENSQAICTLTMDLCRRMIEHYKIEEPLLQMQHTQHE